MADPERQASTAKGKSASWPYLALIVLLVGGGIFFFWVRPARTTNAADSAGAAESSIALETFVVNLNGSSERAYLRVGITLGLSGAPRRNKDELPVALVRDTVLSVLSAAHADQLVQPEGKRQLKEDILKALKNRAPQLGVQDVFFTEFLVQM